MIIAYTLISEILGTLIRKYDNLQIIYLEGYSFYNSLILNIFDIVFFLFFYYVFWHALSSFKSKGLIKYGAILFITSSLLNPFFQDFMLLPQMLASSMGSAVLIGCIILYFNKLRSGTDISNFHNLLFWISLGLLIFYTFYPFILLIGYFNYELYLDLHIRQVHHILISVMYLCFILGFVFMRRVRQK
jgi:hypothetical protein